MNFGQISFTIALVLYFVSAGLYHVPVLLNGKRGARPAQIAALVGWLFQTAGIAHRSLTLGLPPYVELRGAVMTVAWVIVLLTLVVEWRLHTATLGVPAMPVAALAMVMADTLPLFGGIHPLMPSLYRDPMSAHVGSIVAAFGCFALAFCLALLYMVQERRLKRHTLRTTRPGALSLTDIEHLANTFAAFGFSMLTLGLLLGFVWAASGVWKGNWYMEPIVLATIATWAVYAGYLYIRGVKGSRGRGNMYFLIIGFTLAVFTLLVVRPILPGQHG
ncbi:MAG TPA: cytochrome c biogenesis protein CcsA [Armatimonadota bacterium]|jgi:ABC-type transport system involved in cytochrome c biogenesis permease subunit